MTGDDDIDSILRGVAAAPARPFHSLVGSQIGNYQVTGMLGRGGMGTVYLAEHPLIGKKVAIKVLHRDLAQDQEVVARFFTEAKAVNDIHHENIVDVIDFGRAGDRSYILMELLEGESLAARLERGLPPTEEAIHILDQAANALAASHKQGIIHRDIKPDNIFLTRRSHDRCFVKLLDFGIVKLTGNASPWKTQTGAVIGTPLYMSPEQCAGHGRVDPRSDIYSLGVVMYELLSGRLPFPSKVLADILRGHMKEPPPSLAHPLEAIVMKCLAKDPNARFASMNELRAALSAPKHRTTLSHSIGELSAIVVPRRRAPLFVVAGALLTAALAGLFVLGRDSPPPVVQVREPAPAALPMPSPAPAEPVVAAPPREPIAAPKPPRAVKKRALPSKSPAQKGGELDEGLL